MSHIMAFKKVIPTKVSSEPVGALLRVRPEQDEQSVLSWLQEQGATEIEQLAPGFLSVMAAPRTLQAAEKMACVEIKRRKMPHGS